MNQIIATEERTTEVAPKKCFTIKNFAKKNSDNGVWPGSPSAIWALRAGAPENGFGKAFLTVGRRVLVDEEKFWDVVASLQEAKHASRR